MVFSLFTIGRIRTHAEMWALAVPAICLYMYNWDPVQGLSAAAAWLVSVWIHEMGHAVAANRYKLNPQVVLGMLGGYCQHDRAETDAQDAIIIAAGPVVQIIAGFLLAGVWIGIGLVSPEAASFPAISAFFFTFLFISIAWGIFNLLPIWPMDGGKLYRLGLIHILKVGPARADRLTHITSIVVGVLLALLFLLLREPFGVLIIGFIVYRNVQAMRAGASAGPVRRPKNTQAKQLLKQARTALDAEDYREAARLGHQIRALPEVPDRILAPTWEIIAIGSIQSGRYDDGLRFARRAPQTPRVVAARVQGLLAMDRLIEAEELLKSPEFSNMPPAVQDALETEVARARPN